MASHQVKISFTSPQPGWVHQDPHALVDSANEAIEGAMAAANSKFGVRQPATIVPAIVAFGLQCTHSHNTMLQVTASDVVGIGITNQRETTVAWSASSGKPLHNALVWLSTCSEAVNAEVVKELGGDSDALRHVTGLPISTYFSAGKMTWLLQNSEVMPPFAC